MKTGGQVLVDCLRNQNVEIGFGVPGESYLAVLDALYDAQNAIRFVGTRNEGGAAFMAEAYGKLTGRPAICFVTRGPGATNASIGVHTAMQNSTPMILLVGQVRTDHRGREAFQEIDYRAFFGNVAKWVTEIDHADRIPEIMSRAFANALSGRPGPVVVALPEDMLRQMTEAEAGPLVEMGEAGVGAEGISKAVELLETAERPLILAGGGGWTGQGRVDLKTFAEKNALPVLVQFRGQDLMDNFSDCYAGDAGVGMSLKQKELIRSADVILALGVRFGEMLTDAYTLFDAPKPKQKIIHVHPSSDELGKIYLPEITLHAGTGPVLAAVKDKTLKDSGKWAAHTKAARDDYLAALDCPPQPGALDMGGVSTFLRKRLPEDAIVTNGAGNFSTWPNKFLQYGPKARMLAPQSGAMGYGVPAAVMAKIVQPGKLVLCFAGDGDFQMNCQELGTAMQHGAGPIILVINNGMYGTIRMHQERAYPERVIGTKIDNPDFSTLAKAYGFHGEQVTRTEDFEAAWERAVASPTGAVLDLVVDPEGVTPRAAISQLRADG